MCYNIKIQTFHQLNTPLILHSCVQRTRQKILVTKFWELNGPELVNKRIRSCDDGLIRLGILAAPI